MALNDCMRMIRHPWRAPKQHATREYGAQQRQFKACCCRPITMGCKTSKQVCRLRQAPHQHRPVFEWGCIICLNGATSAGILGIDWKGACSHLHLCTATTGKTECSKCNQSGRPEVSFAHRTDDESLLQVCSDFSQMKISEYYWEALGKQFRIA